MRSSFVPNWGYCSRVWPGRQEERRGILASNPTEAQPSGSTEVHEVARWFAQAERQSGERRTTAVSTEDHRGCQEPDFESARRYALERLERELAPGIIYHSPVHTHDIVPAVERLAAPEGVTGADLLLLRTAAYFHDLGFVIQYQDHEGASARIAAEVLPGLCYTPAQVNSIVGMILATRLPQSPHNLLEELLADADLDVLGRDDFMPRNKDLQAELAAMGRPTTEQEWYRSQLNFLRSHRYWTSAARRLRDSGKQANIAALERLLV